MSTRTCPACGAAAGAWGGEKNGFHLVSCGGCKTLYSAYLPSSENAEDYNSYYCTENLSVPAFVQRRLGEVVAGFAAFRQVGRLLDVGFGAGAALEAARRAGWDAYGVEVSQVAVEHARTAGLTVSRGTLHEAEYPTAHFDVVVATEVLEHVPDPRGVLREIARVLRPGGLLWATTPHGRGMSARLLGLGWSVVSPPEHLQLFSIGGIKRLLGQAGLRLARVSAEGMNPYELLHRLRGVPDAPPAAGANLRVESSYRLNEALMASRSRILLKAGLNAALDWTHMGDSLKIWARAETDRLQRGSA